MRTWTPVLKTDQRSWDKESQRQKEDLSVFAHFSKDLRCKHRLPKRADGVHFQPQEMITGVLSIVQDGFLYWLQSYPMNSKDTQETASCLMMFLLPGPEARKELHRQFEGVHQSVPGPAMGA